MSRLPNRRIGLGLYTVGLLSLLASPAIGQTSENAEFVLDLPTAVSLAQAHTQFEVPKPDRDGVSRGDDSELKRRRCLFRTIAVGDDEDHSQRKRRVGGGGSMVAWTGPAFAEKQVVVASTCGGSAGTLGGFFGVLKRQCDVTNAQHALDLQLRMIKRLEADKDAGLLDIAQFDAFRQCIQTGRANLLCARISLEESCDEFNIGQLGLPPETPIVLDDAMVRQFDIVDCRIEALQASLAELRESILESADEAEVGDFSKTADRLAQLHTDIGDGLHLAHADLVVLDAKAEDRKRTMTDDEQRSFVTEQGRLRERLRDLEKRFAESLAVVEASRERLASATREGTAEDLAANCDRSSNLAGEISLVRSLARLHVITLRPFEISRDDALKIAHSHRADWLKKCAALAELRRSLAGGKEADGVAAYREARRALIAYEDEMNGELRQDLRLLATLRENFEIQREAASFALKRVADTCELINEPQPKAHPGQSVDTAGTPGVATRIVSAVQGLADAQNNLVSVYLAYHKNRIEFYQDLGVMRFDERGMWIDEPLEPIVAAAEAYLVPPDIDDVQGLAVDD
jgi:hypothetical protein